MHISDSDAEYRILRNFTANADTILSVESFNDKFKLDWQFRSPGNQFKIIISPSFEEQEIEMLGLSY